MSEQPRSSSPWKARLDTLATILVIATCGILIWRTFGPSSAAPARPAVEVPLPAEPVALEAAALKGSPTAPVVMIEYSEFQCPYCGKFTRDTLPTLDKEYISTGRVQLAFKHFPLEQIHPLAVPAATAADCAAKQGQFWTIHDALFEKPTPLDAGSIPAAAARAGLDEQALAACAAEGGDEKVRAQAKTGADLGVSGTPTFLFGARETDGRVRITKRLSGARPVAEFRAAIDAILDKS